MINPTPVTGHSSDVAELVTPAPARVYDYLLGGKDNYAEDRSLANRLLEVEPNLTAAVRENRAFLGRAVRALTERGIRRFLDIGCGLPTRDNVHQIAMREIPSAHVTYVDKDPIVLAHARAFLTVGDHARVAQGDLRRPEGILEAPEIRALLDGDEPVAILLTAVLHLLPDSEDPYSIVARLRAALSPGSALVISHATGDATPDRTIATARLYNRDCTAPLVPRSRAAINPFLDGLQLLDPGLVFTTQWRPRGPARPAAYSLAYAAVGIR